MSYAWMITRDHFPTEGCPPGTNENAQGLTGPRRAPNDMLRRITEGEGQQFRMYDDDDELMYEGLFIGDSESEDGFGPLDDFGGPNAGCTRIDYWRPNLNGSGTWETL